MKEVDELNTYWLSHRGRHRKLALVYFGSEFLNLVKIRIFLHSSCGRKCPWISLQKLDPFMSSVLVRKRTSHFFQVNVIAHIFFVDFFLGGEFLSYGFDVLLFALTSPENRTDPMNNLFPKVDKNTHFLAIILPCGCKNCPLSKIRKIFQFREWLTT
jgi:hypothetical protein